MHEGHGPGNGMPLMTGRRIASIWFPRFAIQRWARGNEDAARAGPIGLVSEGAHGILIDAVNAQARDGGARPGQRLADARAALPTLAVWPSDKPGDVAALDRLCRWSERWCPFVAIDGSDGLLLDITGAAHLFGGEARLTAEMRARFRRVGLTARIAIAPTVGAAWALARYASTSPFGLSLSKSCPSGASAPKERAGLRQAQSQRSEGRTPNTICPPEALAATLGPLPVSALRLDDDTVLLLGRLGLKTIAALAEIPTLGLARRFARADGPWADPPLRLAQAFGRAEEPVNPAVHAPVPRVMRRVVEPVLHVPILEPLVVEMAEALCRQLAERHAGARHLGFQAFRVDGDVQLLEARTSQAMRDPRHMVRLFAERFETLDAGFGFDAFALTALWHEPLDPIQAGLIEAEHDATSLARLIDRLSARIGPGNVRVPLLVESHLPERALSWQPALGAASVRTAPPPITPERPIRLFDRPEPIGVTYATPEGEPRLFQWRRKQHRIVKVEGPERIAPEWWRERSTTRLRDYYRVEDDAGARFWIYRNGLIEDGRGGMPDWYLHGLFA